MEKIDRTSGAAAHRRAPPGTPPGTLIPDDAAAPTEIRMTVITDERAEEFAGVTLADIRAAKESGSQLWVDVTGLADLDTIAAIGEMFGIKALALEDVANTSQRPKLDLYDTHALIIVHMMDQPTQADKEQFAILLGREHVLTFQEWPGDCLDPVRRRLQAPSRRIRAFGPAYLAYALIDTILDAYFPLLEKVGDRLDILEDAITADPRPSDINQLHGLKRELLVVKRALWPTREMLSSLSRTESDLVPGEIGPFLRDAYDHSIQLIDIVETYREISAGLLDLYLSSVSARMNEVMKVLTIVSTIFIPLTFLAGIWGMNFDPAASPWNMPELRAYYGYPAALGAMALAAIMLLMFFRWKRWL